MTRALIIRLPCEQAEAVKRAARACGLSQNEYCRRVLADAARRDTGQATDDLLGIVKEIRDHIKPSGQFVGAEQDAFNILLKLEVPKPEAARKIRAISREWPGLSAAEMVARAVKPAE